MSCPDFEQISPAILMADGSSGRWQLVFSRFIWNFQVKTVNLQTIIANIRQMTKDACIKILKECMNVLQMEYGIKSVSLFGSTARGEQTDDSDIDLFVDTQTPNPFKLMDAKEFLEQKTGTPVDIVRNHQHLNPRLRKRIEKDAVIIF